ncbi:unnamed protein product [Paramecium primaurelia]|uniref:Uncharacterized protein n=1 Tax=Paramecium primaurelia TaxID=5886 RepID=A0A8S1Q4B9_PARPR|nr:unnamed protein product [Paramecium primaurelia]
MNISSQNNQTQINELQEVTKDQEYFDQAMQLLFRRQFKIIFTKNQEIKIISSNGEIIRSDIILSSCHEDPELPFFNLEQIKHLKWLGKYQDTKKVGKWIATWKNEILLDVGGQYCQKGMKQSRWKEIFKNYFEKAQVYEEGEYINGKRIGIWNTIYQNKLIGGGFYDQQGQKNGQWIELCNYFQCDNQIIYQGEYLNGKKIGTWDINRKRLAIFLNLNGCKKKGNLELIGWEQYDQQGQKNGKWVELSDDFQKETQILYCGEYKSGRKCGIWEIHYQIQSNRPFYLIGCGIYNMEGYKNGRWVEVTKNFLSDGQVIYEGQYKNGKKIGKWDIKVKNDQTFEKIGYGSYDEQEHKNGIWLELSENYRNIYSEVTYYGEYKKDKKIGKWEIYYKQSSNYPFKLIGSGSYNDESVKYGIWIELSDYFSNQNEVLYQGVYQNGRKVGKWDIKFKSHYFNDFHNIGGGIYDNQNLKHASWVDVGDNFSKNQSIIHKGEYNHGKKIGLWEEMRICCENTIFKIGEKIYD